MNNKQEEFIDKKIFEIRLNVYAGIEEQLAETKKDIKKAIEEDPELMDECNSVAGGVENG